MNLASDGGPALRDIPRQGPIASLPVRVGTHGPLASPKLSPVGRENGVWSWSPTVTGWMVKYRRILSGTPRLGPWIGTDARRPNHCRGSRHQSIQCHDQWLEFERR